jgi:hypothetical protein
MAVWYSALLRIRRPSKSVSFLVVSCWIDSSQRELKSNHLYGLTASMLSLLLASAAALAAVRLEGGGPIACSLLEPLLWGTAPARRDRAGGGLLELVLKTSRWAFARVKSLCIAALRVRAALKPDTIALAEQIAWQERRRGGQRQGCRHSIEMMSCVLSRLLAAIIYPPSRGPRRVHSTRRDPAGTAIPGADRPRI